MKLPDRPQPVEVASNDGSIVVGVTDWGHPTGVQLEPEVKHLAGADLAARILTLYEFAKTIALAVRNVEHHRATGNWLRSWPTPTNVDILRAQLTV
ncbi:hypothetical protein C1Y40_04572 [Mycobacterium talmoniae]|uniref:Uncharacterized protein n=1 Tax=Mycobacterium talmoniae TaxID=1858794 RepID=A0A2S8BF38_9MYCO|nr:hypothetical protein [Mycobacterium eburneum]PQM45248.1 hypothetical protein C1Y40_04572 [Mycobacterium talmoniae]